MGGVEAIIPSNTDTKDDTKHSVEEETLPESAMDEPPLQEPTLPEPTLEEPTLQVPPSQVPILEEPNLQELTLPEPTLYDDTDILSEGSLFHHTDSRVTDLVLVDLKQSWLAVIKAYLVQFWCGWISSHQLQPRWRLLRRITQIMKMCL